MNSKYHGEAGGGDGNDGNDDGDALLNVNPYLKIHELPRVD